METVEELNSLLLVFEVLGMQFFSLKRLHEDDIGKRPSLYRTIYFAVILSVSSYSMFLYATAKVTTSGTTDTENVNRKNIILIAISYGWNFGTILAGFSCVIQSFISTVDVKTIFVNSKTIARLLDEEFKIFSDYKKSMTLAWLRLSVLATFFIVLYGVSSVYFVESMQTLYVTVVGTLPTVYLLLTIYKFVFYIIIVNDQLEQLNKAIAENFEQENLDSLISSQVVKVKPLTSIQNPLRNLQAARKIYNLIYENCLLVNSSNGLTILIVIVIGVASATSSGYEAFIIAVDGLSTKRLSSTAYTLLLATIPFLPIFFYCERTETFMSQLSAKINLIDCNSCDRDSAEMRENAMQLYLQVTHQPVKFTALGFFEFNFVLLASIVTGVVSYQIILVQFYAS